MIKLKDLLLEKKLTDKDINVGDAYHRKTHVGYMVNFVYGKYKSIFLKYFSASVFSLSVLYCTKTKL